jgi:hypothetical protein
VTNAWERECEVCRGYSSEAASSYRRVHLEKQLAQEAKPEGKWTGIMFLLGRGVKEITSASSPKGDWTDHAFRLGKMLRRGLNKS